MNMSARAAEASEADRCPYCLEFNRGGEATVLGAVRWPYQSRVVHRTPHMVVAPTFGALVPNYLLLIPFDHALGARHLPHEQLSDLARCIAMLEGRFHGSTFFEHGAVNARERSGASIDHVHLHFLPFDLDLRVLTPRYTYSELHDLADITTLQSEYIFVRVSRRNYWAPVECLPSQFLRQVVAAALGVPRMWNWRENVFRENMIATYESWTGEAS